MDGRSQQLVPQPEGARRRRVTGGGRSHPDDGEGGMVGRGHGGLARDAGHETLVAQEAPQHLLAGLTQRAAMPTERAAERPVGLAHLTGHQA